MKKLDTLALVLVIIGGLNWGLVAIGRFDLVAWIFGNDFGQTNVASRVVYGLVGLSAVYVAVRLPKLLSAPSLSSTSSAQPHRGLSRRLGSIRPGRLRSPGLDRSWGRSGTAIPYAGRPNPDERLPPHVRRNPDRSARRRARRPAW